MSDAAPSARSPRRSRAARHRCTWPSEAAAIGVDVASRPSSSSAAGRRRASAASMSASASAVGYDGTTSQSFWSSYTAAGGITSGRIESLAELDERRAERRQQRAQLAPMRRRQLAGVVRVGRPPAARDVVGDAPRDERRRRRADPAHARERHARVLDHTASAAPPWVVRRRQLHRRLTGRVRPPRRRACRQMCGAAGAGRAAPGRRRRARPAARARIVRVLGGCPINISTWLGRCLGVFFSRSPTRRGKGRDRHVRAASSVAALPALMPRPRGGRLARASAPARPLAARWARARLHDGMHIWFEAWVRNEEDCLSGVDPDEDFSTGRPPSRRSTRWAVRSPSSCR